MPRPHLTPSEGIGAQDHGIEKEKTNRELDSLL